MKKILLITILSLLSAQPVFSAEPDFIMVFDNCKSTFAPLYLAEEAVITAEADPVTMACTRSNGTMDCQLDNNSEVTQQKYDIAIDNPPFLAFRTDGGGDFVTVHTINHAAVLSSRLASTQMLGAKVCHGTFMTSSELKSLGAAEPAED